MGRSEYASEMARRATFRVSEIKKGLGTPTKNPTFRPDYLLEVPGGLEPPYSVLQTDT